ncbi:MAG: hypothetical protein LUH14_00480 [Clostridiaceae bacterium]|nr:hypothetical protein [Clostridiaceae bacterium]
MSEEKDLEEKNINSEMEPDDLASFVDLADLGDLDQVSNMDLFGSLGDLDDLGDVPDLNELPDMNSVMPSEASDLAQAMEANTDESLGEMFAGVEPSVRQNGEAMFQDADAEEEEADLEQLLGGLDLDALGNETFDEPLEAEQTVDGAGAGTALPEGALEQAAEAGLNGIDDSTLQDISLDAIDDSALQDISLDAIDDSALQDISLDAIDDSALQDIGLDALDSSGSVLGEAASDASEKKAEVPGQEVPMQENDENGLNSMLDGLLDNLDMGGSAEDMPDPFAGEPGQDAFADVLGLDELSSMQEGEAEADDLMGMLDVDAMLPQEPEEKKPGFMKKVFGNVVTDEIAEQERRAAEQEEEEAARKAEEEAKEKEEKAAQKEAKKAEKEARAAEKKRIKEALKAEKEAQKAEKKAKQEEEEAAELEVVGKLNKIGVSIIAAATVLFLGIEIIGTNAYGYSSAKKSALKYFDMGKYTEAYQEAIGTNMKEKDPEEYQKIKTVMLVQQSLNSYQNYDRMKFYPEALDALLRGIKRYDANIEQGQELEVDKEMLACRKEILSLLQEEFGVSEQEAYELLALEKEDYTKRVVEIGVEKK